MKGVEAAKGISSRAFAMGFEDEVFKGLFLP